MTDSKLRVLLDAISGEGKAELELHHGALEKLRRHLQEKPESRPSAARRVWDSKVPQLHLRIMPSGVMSFNVQWSRKNSKSLGRFPDCTLAIARKKAVSVIASAHESKDGVPEIARRPDPQRREETVGDACREYVAWLRKEGRSDAAKDVEGRFERTVYQDPIAAISLQVLHQEDVEAWRDRVEAGRLADLPSKKGRPAKAKPLSRSTTNRMRSALVAALNRAVDRRRVGEDRAIEWRSVKPYQNAGTRRDIYLDVAQRRAMLEAAQGPVRDLIEFVALTGCRPGDPAAALREDYDARTGIIRLRTKRHDRRIPLSPSARALLDRLAMSKLPKAHLFTQADGKPWNPTAWRDGVRAAAQEADLPEGTTLYTLRHCWITDAIVGGMDLLTVAKLAGTSLAMIEKHYGHLVQGAAMEKLAAIDFM